MQEIVLLTLGLEPVKTEVAGRVHKRTAVEVHEAPPDKFDRDSQTAKQTAWKDPFFRERVRIFFKGRIQQLSEVSFPAADLALARQDAENNLQVQVRALFNAQDPIINPRGSSVKVLYQQEGFLELQDKW